MQLMNYQNQTEIKAPAKLNLGLLIPFKRETDGYHHLVSLFMAVNICDTLIINRAERFSLTAEFSSHISNEVRASFSESEFSRNLLFKQWEWFREKITEFQGKTPDWYPAIHIEKHIPSPAGLGGGSSDAAALLKWLLSQTLDEKQSLSFLNRFHSSLEKLGADIPFFMQKNTALVSGISEPVAAFHMPDLKGLVATLPYHFATKDMYSALKKPLQDIKNQEVVLSVAFGAYGYLKDILRVQTTALNPGVEATLPAGDYRPLLEETSSGWMLKNEFLTAVREIDSEKFSELRRVMNDFAARLNRLTGRKDEIFFGMSGSGPSVYALTTGRVSDRELAEAAEELQAENCPVYVCSNNGL